MSGQRIPVNIITGFLGVGKTTSILELLAKRPESETWAVLVNEFGKVPIDEAAMRAVGEEGMQIAEVSGGCLCCSAGVDTRLALKRLIEEASPDRILIEPTGLGHPDRIREAVLEGIEDERIRPAASICLVDPRQCLKPGIENILSYWAQVAMADVIVMNKTDLVDEDIVRNCRELLDTKYGDKSTIIEKRDGFIPLNFLEITSEAAVMERLTLDHHHHEHPGHEGSELVVELLEGKAQRVESSGLGHFGCGWRFDPGIKFSLGRLEALFKAVVKDDHRIKGIFRTDEGWMLFNAVGAESSWKSTLPSADSRLEHIQPTSPGDWGPYESRLLDCRL